MVELSLVVLGALVALLEGEELSSVALGVLVALLEAVGLLSVALGAQQMESHRLLSEESVEQGLPRIDVNSLLIQYQILLYPYILQ